MRNTILSPENAFDTSHYHKQFGPLFDLRGGLVSGFVVLALAALSPVVLRDFWPWSALVAGVLLVMPLSAALLGLWRGAVLRGLLWACLLLAVSVWHLPPWGAYSRPGGFLINPNAAGAALALALVAAVAFKRWAYAVAFIMALGLTVSIGAWLGAAAGLLALLAQDTRARALARRFWPLTGAGLLMGLGGGLGGLVWMMAARPWWLDRLQMWRAALWMLSHGGHRAGFHVTFYILTTGDPGWLHGRVFEHCHNLYLQTALGGPLWLAVGLLAGLWLAYKAQRPGRALLAVVACHGLVDNTLAIPVILILLGLLYASSTVRSGKASPYSISCSLSGPS